MYERCWIVGSDVDHALVEPVDALKDDVKRRRMRQARAERSDDVVVDSRRIEKRGGNRYVGVQGAGPPPRCRQHARFGEGYHDNAVEGTAGHRGRRLVRGAIRGVRSSHRLRIVVTSSPQWATLATLDTLRPNGNRGPVRGISQLPQREGLSGRDWRRSHRVGVGSVAIMDDVVPSHELAALPGLRRRREVLTFRAVSLRSRGEMVAVKVPSGSGEPTLSTVAGSFDRMSAGGVLVEARSEREPDVVGDTVELTVGTAHTTTRSAFEPIT